MGVESVPVAEALSHVDTLEISRHSLLEYSCQLWNPWKAKDIQAIEAIQRMFTYKITEVHFNYLERLRDLKLFSLQHVVNVIFIYIWKITQQMEPNIDGVMLHTIETRKHLRHGTHAVLNRQKPSTIPSSRCYIIVFAWASVVQLVVAKISERHRKC